MSSIYCICESFSMLCSENLNCEHGYFVIVLCVGVILVYLIS